MAYINLSLDAKIARSQVLNEMIGANATIDVYDGTYPPTPDDPADANTLVSFICDPNEFGTVSVQMLTQNTVQLVTNTVVSTISNSVVNTVTNTITTVVTTVVTNTTMDVITNVTSEAVTLISNVFPPQLSIANGTAGWARIYDVNGNAIVDMDVGLSNASITINSTDLIAGIPVQVVAIIITEQ